MVHMWGKDTDGAPNRIGVRSAWPLDFSHPRFPEELRGMDATRPVHWAQALGPTDAHNTYTPHTIAAERLKNKSDKKKAVT